jgi:hypothetical protein
MSPDDRNDATIGRRRVLGLAALAALPLVGCAKPERAVTEQVDASESLMPSETPTSAPPKPVVTKGGGPVPFRPGKVMLGSYLDLEGLSLGESIALRRRQLDRDPRILHVFYAWTDDLPRSVPEMPDTSTLLVSWRGTFYDEINDGYWDRSIATAAKRLARHDRPVLLRWGWEMNGDWYKWGGDSNGRRTASYVKAWRRLHRIFGEEGATNVSWVWSPNWNSRPDLPWNDYRNYYPGDKYVDWVGVSGYNFHKETPERLFSGICEAYGAEKPIMITEVGAVDRGAGIKADWITRFAAWVQENPAVGGVVWFDTDTHAGTTEKFRIDSNEDSLAAFRAMAVDAHFSG